MTEKKDNIFEKVLTFTILILLWETIILVGSFIIFKLSLLYVSDLSLLSFLVDNLRETIKEYSFIEFITANKPYCILVSFFSIILAFSTLE